MRLVYVRRDFTKMQERQLKKIVMTLSYTNRRAFINTKSSPYAYLDRLKEYGLLASATPVMEHKRLIGYNFKNVS